MSARLEARQTSSEIFPRLKETLKLSWLKRETTKFNFASAAITKNGIHFSGLMESRTHLLDISSEQASIALAVSRKDPFVNEVVTIVDGNFEENPLVLKILGDHSRRTGVSIKYTVIDLNEKGILSLSVAEKYNPSPKKLDFIDSWQPRPNFIPLTDDDLISQLKSAALKGMETHFSADTKTKYGSAVLANGKFYFGGVYSSFDHRLNLHSEMVAALGAIMDNNRAIEMVGIISNKFVDELSHMCGCCRQFFSEIQEKTKKPITVVVFSFDSKQVFQTTLNAYFPDSWSSGLSFDQRSALKDKVR